MSNCTDFCSSDRCDNCKQKNNIDLDKMVSEAMYEYYRNNHDLNGLTFLANKSFYSLVYSGIMVASSGTSTLYGHPILVFNDNNDKPRFMVAKELDVYYKSMEEDCICT